MPGAHTKYTQVAPQLHDKRVAEVQRQVKAWNASGQRGKKLMCTDRSPWLSVSSVSHRCAMSATYPVWCATRCRCALPPSRPTATASSVRSKAHRLVQSI
eukprot:439962-Rhodomonas_salina.2